MQVCQLRKAQLTQQLLGWYVEGKAAALDEIYLLSVEQLRNDSTDCFGCVAPALGSAADAVGEGAALPALQLFQSGEQCRHSADAQVADQMTAGFFYNAVTTRFLVLEPAEIGADIRFCFQDGPPHHPGHFIIHSIGGIIGKIRFFQPAQNQPVSFQKDIIHGVPCSCPVRRTA